MFRFIEAVLILSGMIIGVGMFGIPFSFVQSGFWLGAIELVILAVVVLLIHLLYGEVVLGTDQYHRLPGYARLYLGRRGVLLAWFSAFFGIVGTLLAYTIVNGVFLNNIFKGLFIGLNEFWWAIGSMALAGLITLLSAKKETFLGSFLTIFEIGLIIFLVIILTPHVDTAKLVGFNPQHAFFPYGILFFALSGAVIIPDIVAIVGKDRSRRARLAISFGTLIPAIIYFLFAAAVIGVAGSAVSEEAILGLRPFLGEKVVLIGSLMGFMAVFTSLVALLISFQELLKLDFGLSKKPAWFISVFVPVIFYALGFQKFIVIISLIGAVAVGIDAALIIVSHHRMRLARGERASSFSCLWKSGIFLMIAAGIFYEVYKFFYR